MRYFWRFVSDLWPAWLVAGLVFVVGLAVDMIISEIVKGHNETRKEIYLSFQNSSSDSSKSDQFFKMVNLVYTDGGKSLKERIKAVHIFSEDVSAKKEEFLSLDPEIIHTLLSGKATLTDIAEWEKKDQTRALTIKPVENFVIAFAFWRPIGILVLIIIWVREGFSMDCFPCRKWWFWIYLILSSFWSLAIVLILASTKVFYWAGIAAFKRGRKEPFEVFCLKLKRKTSETRQRWLECFPPSYAQARAKELSDSVDRLREKLQTLGQEMEQTEKEYYSTKATAEVLRERFPQGRQQEKILVLRKDWEDEFGRIVSNTCVEAVEITEAGPGADRKKLYTIPFHTAYGVLGPMKIGIDFLEPQHYSAGLVNCFAGRGTNAAVGTSGFCFGNQASLIRSLLEDWKTSDALAVMINGFKSVGGS